MTKFNNWKALNEMDLKSTTTKGLGGTTSAGRVGTGLEELITGNLPPMQKSLALVDVLAQFLAQIEEDERKTVISQLYSKLKTAVSKVAKSLGSNV